MFGSSIHDFIAQCAVMVPAFLLAFSFHEFSHALVAVLLGDPTPREEGRLTLNPLVHVDPVGLIFLVVFHFGWGKPVEFDKNNFRWPKLYSLFTALAGPFSNFLLALLCMIVLKYMIMLNLSKAALITVTQLLRASISVNIMLGVFNLLPIPPLDGGHILTTFLIDSYPQVVEAFYRYAFLIILAVFFIFPIAGTYLQYAMSWVNNIMFNFVFNTF